VTFSVFLPSLINSCAVWVNPSSVQKPSSVAHSKSLFMIGNLPWLEIRPAPKTPLRL
jgi:hypothetical protein